MPSRQESTYCREGESIEMAQRRNSTENLQESATATKTRDTYDQKNVAVRYELQFRPYQLAWLKEELEYFKEWIEFCLYSKSEDAIKWRIDNSGIAKDGFIKEHITEAEYILDEIDRSFSGTELLESNTTQCFSARMVTILLPVFQSNAYCRYA